MRCRGSSGFIGALSRVVLVVGALGCNDVGHDGLTDSGGTPEPLSAKNFDGRFYERYCEELIACSDGYRCDNLTTTPLARFTSCDFDLDAASACLEHEWSCDEGFELPILPAACNEVYDCGTGGTTGWTTTT